MSHFIPRDCDFAAGPYKDLALKVAQASLCFETLIGMGYFTPSPLAIWADGDYKLQLSKLVVANSRRVSVPKKDQS
jgi:hypothetical protein